MVITVRIGRERGKYQSPSERNVIAQRTFRSDGDWLLFLSFYSSLTSRYAQPPRRVADAAHFTNPAIIESAFDQLVAEQREDAPAHEEWSSVAVPIYTGCAAIIVHSFFWTRIELAEFL